MIEGLHRDGPSLLPFFGTGWTVYPDSPAADAIRRSPHYQDARREGIAWSTAVEKAEAKAAGREPHDPPYCEPACDVFALNATANGWLIGEKLEASTDCYTPAVPADQRRVLESLGREPLDLTTLEAQTSPELTVVGSGQDHDAEPDGGIEAAVA
jgi:hypothetical protein